MIKTKFMHKKLSTSLFIASSVIVCFAIINCAIGASFIFELLNKLYIAVVLLSTLYMLFFLTRICKEKLRFLLTSLAILPALFILMMLTINFGDLYLYATKDGYEPDKLINSVEQPQGIYQIMIYQINPGAWSSYLTVITQEKRLFKILKISKQLFSEKHISDAEVIFIGLNRIQVNFHNNVTKKNNTYNIELNEHIFY